MSIYQVCNKKKRKRRKCFASLVLRVNAVSPFHINIPLLYVFFMGSFFWEKYITAAVLSREWTTGIMWREVYSSCSGLFLFALAIPICSLHSDAMPSLYLLTSFSFHFDVDFLIQYSTNCKSRDFGKSSLSDRQPCSSAAEGMGHLGDGHRSYCF